MGAEENPTEQFNVSLTNNCRRVFRQEEACEHQRWQKNRTEFPLDNIKDNRSLRVKFKEERDYLSLSHKVKGFCSNKCCYWEYASLQCELYIFNVAFLADKIGLTRAFCVCNIVALILVMSREI
ncbi:unnamed protein product [Albugo candida]|uniref:Uncharacterized protein n=1 Tax=Albugo candida TaxID=65357 RepID=A0A024FTQ9_9STRA|nr:unnamed protein product [Albugo candida]|eukprot:CCI10480.1 unnamed protein product [Albugo candida]